MNQIKSYLNQIKIMEVILNVKYNIHKNLNIIIDLEFKFEWLN